VYDFDLVSSIYADDNKFPPAPFRSQLHGRVFIAGFSVVTPVFVSTPLQPVTFVGVTGSPDSDSQAFVRIAFSKATSTLCPHFQRERNSGVRANKRLRTFLFPELSEHTLLQTCNIGSSSRNFVVVE
jgi:hypothetical protein